MSAASPPTADEICLLARNPYDAGQRALWHLDKIGSLIDCTAVRSASLGPDVELVYAVPLPERKNMSAGRVFPHSASTEEFGFVGDALSPRSPSPILPSIAMSPCSMASASTMPESANSTRYLRISDKTKIKFFNPVSVAVFSLDLSPSMNVVDTSFKSVTTGCHLVDNVVHSLALALKCLAAPPKIQSLTECEFPFVPQLVVTVIAHGVPELGVFPLLVGETVTEHTIPLLISKVNFRIREAIDKLAVWMQANHAEEQLAGAVSCSRTRNPCTSQVCQANDVSVVIRDCLTAVSMTCSQLGLSKAGVNKSIMLLTDGVMAHPRKLPYDNILMHLNFVDVALHILQIGGGFAPWSALGYVSDPDLLRLLAATTPTGVFLQDHHLEPILGGQVQPATRGIFGPTPHVSVNVLWKAWVLKFSPLTTSVKSGKRCHMPYRSVTYQSSVLVRGDDASPRSRNGGTGPFSYIDHIEASSISRREHSLKLQGISEDAVNCGGSVGVSSLTSSPLVRKRVASVDSMPSVDSNESESDDDEGGSREIQTLKSYLQPEKAKARPYLYKQYKLPGVSAAQIIQIRAREGFLIETHSISTASRASVSAIHRVASGGGLTTSAGLSRTASTTSMQGLSPNGPAADTAKKAILMSMHWGPVMDIIYEITSSAEEEDGGSELYMSRPSEELRIKLYLGMPSGEFFLKFKQQVSVASSAAHVPSSETHFWQMCRQLDAFVDSIFNVDDTLTKITCPKDRPGLLARRSVSDPKLPAPPAGIQRHMSATIDRRSSTSLDKIAEHTNGLIQTSASQESLGSGISSIPPSPPLTPQMRDPAPPSGLEMALLKQVLPRDVSTWHRWFTVRNLFVLLDVSTQLANHRIRHGGVGTLLGGARGRLVEAIRALSQAELESGCKFYCRVSEWDCVKALVVNSHTANVLCRSNDTVIGRLVGDTKLGTVTDPVQPFILIDIVPASTGITEMPSGVVKLNVAFFAMCPAMERAVVDALSRKLSDSGEAVLIDAPSPIFRAIQSGTLTRPSAAVKRPQQASKKPSTVQATGMGTGESFYTYTPETLVVSRFMLHHAWESLCPPASVLTDVMTAVHERRMREGWKCIQETTNSVIYAHFTPIERAPPKGIIAAAGMSNLQKLWIPSTPVDTPLKSGIRSDSQALDVHDVSIDWSALMRTDSGLSEPAGSRNSIRGMCMCLFVQHVQVRGEKPFINCQFWADQGHSDLRHQPEAEFRSFCEGLCDFD